jgi:hypothetical protein
MNHMHEEDEEVSHDDIGECKAHLPWPRENVFRVSLLLLSIHVLGDPSW